LGRHHVFSLLFFVLSLFVWNSDSEAFTSSVGLPNKTLPEESEPPQGHVRNKFPSPNRKQSSTCLVREAVPQAVVVLWRKMEVVAMKKIRNRLW
jgi:hypothetical protein